MAKRYWSVAPDGRVRKLKRFKKGSPEAKRYMSRIRRHYGRRRTYIDGLSKRTRY